VRWWNHLRAVAAARVPVVILFYHRVAEAADNPWTVSHRMFIRQLSWLRSNFELVSLAEAHRRIRRGANHQRCVSITFDDGYADNCTYALPLLVEERIPFTYFVTLHNVLSGEPFAHDLIWGKPCAPNTLAQICALAEAGVEIGSHGFSHTDLGAIDNQRVLNYELLDSRDVLQRLVGRPVRYFAFPFGQPNNMSPRALRAAREAGYEAVCSAYGGLNFSGDEAFHLLRIGVDHDLI
jgi:peptidoglycan/xylan/chitin deacetylase (PgdA/CDA1 family)